MKQNIRARIHVPRGPSVGRRKSAGILIAVLAIALAACGTATPTMVHGGSWYEQQPWPHDGNPVESANFVVYSDGASLEARRELADAAEGLWAEVLADLEVTPEMLLYPSGKEKIDIFAYYDHFPTDWSGRGYYGGLLIWAPDHTIRQFDREGYEPVLKHELIHVLQWMLTGARGTFDTWFIEGLPLALADDLAGTPIRSAGALAALVDEYGSVSPISIKQYSQITDPNAGEHFYYPLFQLAFEYLLDPNGLGRSPADARDVMIDVGAGSSFETAFEEHFGVRLQDFDDGFFDLMEEYLVLTPDSS